MQQQREKITKTGVTPLGGSPNERPRAGAFRFAHGAAERASGERVALTAP